MHVSLPPGYQQRPPTADDIPAILRLMRAVDVAESGEHDPDTAEHILRDWEGLDLGSDGFVVLAPDGLLCGYALLTAPGAGRLVADGYVHPDQRGRGIGTTLVEAMEQRATVIVAAQPAGTRQVLVNYIQADSPAARTVLETRGYRLTRVFFRMHITLESPPPTAIWPEGIRVRVCTGSQVDLHRIHATLEESFQDHWGRLPRSFEDFVRDKVNESFDPSLWFLAESGSEVAGVVFCRVRDTGRGWISTLGVRRPWRKRGLGLALLQHAFAAFYQRDILRVGLGVDGESLTGAQRLYERAGMQVTMRGGRYEKELRPGRDLLHQA